MSFRRPSHFAERKVCRDGPKVRLLFQRFTRAIECVGGRVEVPRTMNRLLMIEEQDRIFINIDRIAGPEAVSVSEHSLLLICLETRLFSELIALHNCRAVQGNHNLW